MRTELVRSRNGTERVATGVDRHRRSGGRERSAKHLIRPRGIDGKLVAALELRDETAEPFPRIHRPRTVLDVLARRAPRELAHTPDAGWPRREAQFPERPVEVPAAREADFRIEVRPHRQVLQAGTVTIRVVIESPFIALVIAAQVGRGGPRPVCAEAHVAGQPERPVHAVGLVRAGTSRGDRPVRRHHADGAPPHHIPLESHDGEVRRLRLGHRFVAGLDIHDPDGVRSHLPRQAATGIDRHDPTTIEADAARVEQVRRVGRVGAPSRPNATPGKVKDPAPFEEEVTLLGEKEAEAREVDLLLVDLHLREVGVDREVGRQVRRDRVFGVAADPAPEIVGDRGGPHAIRLQARDDVRFELEIQPRGREIETDQRAAGGNAVQCLRAGQALRHRGQVGPFVLATHRAPQLDAPDLVRPRPIPDRLERDRHFHRPATLEPPRFRGPDGIPVRVGTAFIDDGVVGSRA